MRRPDENKLDRQFREGLTDPESNAAFREEDWTAMEELLDEVPNRKKRLVWLYYVSGGIAAMLLLFMIWPLLNIPSDDNQGSDKIVDHVSTEKKQDTSVSADNNSENDGISPVLPSGTVPAGRKKSGLSRPFLTYSKPANSLKVNGRDTALIKIQPVYAEQDSIKYESPVILARTDSAQMTSPEPKQASETEPVFRNKGPRISLAILTAPDLNAVNSFGGQLGVNAGLMVQVKISQKWSASTGIGYAVKPYQINYSQFNGAYNYGYGSARLDQVAANCKVLDIPVNISYQLYEKGKHGFSAGAGLSSYFMLREEYRFDYADNTEWSYNISNQNQHILGVLNLNATYQRQVNRKFNFLIQPYMKLPLTKIGNEGIDLRSVGVAFGVGWNMNRRKIK